MCAVDDPAFGAMGAHFRWWYSMPPNVVIMVLDGMIVDFTVCVALGVARPCLAKDP